MEGLVYLNNRTKRTILSLGLGVVMSVGESYSRVDTHSHFKLAVNRRDLVYKELVNWET